MDDTAAKALYWHFPWLYKLLDSLPSATIQYKLTGYKRLLAQGQTAVTNSRASSTSRNIFANVLEQADKEDGSLTDSEILVEAGAFMLAGTDTTANTLTYLVYNVLSNPQLHKTLEDEIDKVSEPFTDSMLSELPVLNAVITETLRLHGAAPGALQRIAPRGGVYLGQYYIPAGTNVSTQAWSLHRDPNVFPDPEK